LCKCTIANARMFRCARSEIYNLANKHQAMRLSGSAGITTHPPTFDVGIDLIFDARFMANSFEDGLRMSAQSRNGYRASLGLPTYQVLNFQVTTIAFDSRPVLERILKEHYVRASADDDISAECIDDCASELSVATAVSITPGVVTRSIEKINILINYKMNFEKAHLMSQSLFPQYADDVENCIFMCRLLHEHYDALKKVDKVSTFAIRFISHNDRPIPCEYVDNLTSLSSARYNAFDCTVRIIFLCEEDCLALQPAFKDYTNVTNRSFDLSISSRDPKKFKYFLDYKEEEVYSGWRKHDPHGDHTEHTVVGFDLNNYPKPIIKARKRKASVQLTAAALKGEMEEDTSFG